MAGSYDRKGAGHRPGCGISGIFRKKVAPL